MQLKLDFSRVTASALIEEKKTELVSFRITDKLKSDLAYVAQAKGLDLSALVYEYVVKCYVEDLKEILLVQSKGNVTVRDLLGKG